MDVPDKSLAIKDDQISNLKSILMKQGGADNILIDGGINMVLEILKDKLMSNLKTLSLEDSHIPVVYH